MPELPEVEIYKHYLDKTSLHQKIAEITVTNPKVLENAAIEFCNALVGDSLATTRRWGKNLFLGTSSGRSAVMHFGMTGSVEYYHSSLDSPKYSRIIFKFDTGFHLAYVSKRMFGRVGLIPDITSYITGKSLAPDALEIDLSQFTANVRKRQKNIKAVLLDQSTAAGVGNWIADEILFQSRIHPASPSRVLSEDQISLLYEKMQEIIKTAIAGNAVREDLPKHYITRYGRKSTIACPHCHKDIEKTVIAGRGTYACDSCQLLLG